MRGIIYLRRNFHHQAKGDQMITNLIFRIKNRLSAFWESTSPRNPEGHFGGTTTETAHRLTHQRFSEGPVTIDGMRTNR